MAPGTDHLERAQEQLRAHDLDALFVGPSADLRYLVGYDALALERLTLLVVPADGEATLIVPELEAPRARSSGATDAVSLRTWDETDDPFDDVVNVARAAGVASGHFAVQDRLWTTFTLRLQARLDGRGWVPGNTIMRELRIVKQPDELDALRRVARAIDTVHGQVADLLVPGRTETEVGRDIAERIRETHDEVGFVIVGSGPNGASPHHEIGSRRLEEGDAVVVDIGGVLDGYCSDATRNYVVGHAPDGYADLHELLLVAQQAGVAAVRPGARAQDIDRACRQVIADAGHGEHFIHRTGHGIGIEEHEEPWIVSGNDLELRPGMTFSVEPGIYLPDRYGARIEDIVAVTADGVERLNTRSREYVTA